MTKPIKYRQEVVFLKEWYQPGSVPKARSIPMPVCPDRVWTLFTETDENKPPRLPIVPVHRHNAFLEDKLHDWNWRASKIKPDPKFKCCGGNDDHPPIHTVDCPDRAGTFDFSSRVADRPVWILLEFKL